jgi:hypothetical protein
MAKFVKFTDPDGEASWINLDHIVKATVAESEDEEVAGTKFLWLEDVQTNTYGPFVEDVIMLS